MSKAYRIENEVQMVYDILGSDAYKERSKVRKEYFTRKRKLSFRQTILYILGGTKKGLQAGLHIFFKEIKEERETYTKQAFSKGRQRIKPEAFLELFQAARDGFYQVPDCRLFQGYRVSAIDGTKYNLPNTDELRSIYGEQPGSHQVQAIGSCLYDVLNGVLLDVSLEPYRTSERTLAVRHIDALCEMPCHKQIQKEILMMDRGYPSAELLRVIQAKNLFYLMRCSTEFIRAITLRSNDSIVTHRFCTLKEDIRLRVIRYRLPNDRIEILITNLLEMPYEDIVALYRLRWKIESKYDDLKNKLQIENFSGSLPIVIQQDFYATMFLSNLVAGMLSDSADEINNGHDRSPSNQYQYVPNISMAISIAKMELYQVMLCDSNRKRKKLFRAMLQRLSQSVIPIRPDRDATERKRRHGSLRFPQNRKFI